MDLTATLQARIEPEPNSGCWLWLGTRVRGGYGRLKRRRRNHAAHRLAYEAFVGPIPLGLQVLHRCDVPPCVNPAHLFLGTQADNVHDCRQKGRARWNPVGLSLSPIPARLRAKTHCPQGHPYSGPNLIVYRGSRMCRDCQRAYIRRWRERRREGHGRRRA